MSREKDQERLIGHLVQSPAADHPAILTSHRDFIDTRFLDRVGDYGQSQRSDDPDQARRWFDLGVTAAEVAGLDGYLLRFHYEIGALDYENDRRDEARMHLSAAMKLGTQLTRDSDPAVLGAWSNACANSAASLAEDGNVDQAMHLLNETRRRAFDLGYAPGEFIAVCQLLTTASLSGAHETAVEYARLASSSWDRIASALRSEDRDNLRNVLAAALETTAANAYYEGGDWQTAADLAERASRVAPDAQGPIFILGSSQLRLERYADAESTWRRAVEIDPKKPAHHTNLAQTLHELGRDDEAIAEIRISLQFDPSQHRQRLGLAQLLFTVGEHEQAVRELDDLLTRLEPELRTANDAAPAPTSMEEYERNTPPRDLADFARLSKAQMLFAMDEFNQAMAECDHIIATGDASTVSAAADMRGAALAERGAIDDAIAAYTQSLDAMPNSETARQGRAALNMQRGCVEDALEDLYCLVRQDDTDAAIAAATALIEEDPSDARGLLKLRGYALWRAWKPSSAATDLDRAAQLTPDDPEVLLWRSLNLITWQPDDDDWNGSFTLGRVVDAIEGLARAVMVGDQHAEALTAYKWLVDRAAVVPPIEEWLRATGEDGIEKVVPGYLDAARRQWNAFALAEARQWARAVEEHTAVADEFERIGLPVTAARCHVLIADNHLRLYQLQLAADHIRRARNADFLMGRPLTTTLRSTADEQDAHARQAGAPGAVSLELDYLPIYGLRDPVADLQLNVLEAQLHARSGDYEAAARVLDTEEGMLADPASLIASGVSVQSLVAVARVLRDIGDVDRALRLTTALEQLAQTTSERLAVLTTRASVMEQKGDPACAAELYAAASEIVPPDDARMRAFVALQHAANLCNSSLLNEAAPILDSVDITQPTFTDFDRSRYFQLQALVLRERGDLTAALSALQESFKITEGIRREFLQYDQRIAWQAEYQHWFTIGVETALQLGDARLAFEFVERSRARVLVEQLMDADVELDEHGRELERILENARRRHDLLIELDDSILARGPRYIDIEVVRELTALGEDVVVDDDVLSESKIHAALDRVAPNIDRLADEVEQARLSAVSARTLDVLDLSAIQGLLADATTNDGVTLAEYYTTEDQIILFLLRTDDVAPTVVRFPFGTADQVALLDVMFAHADGAGEEADAASRTLETIVRPVLQHAERGDLIWFVPHGVLHYVALHAVIVDGRAVIDDHPVCSTPSASTLSYVRADAERRTDHAIVVGDTGGDLPHSRAEAEAVAKRFGVEPLVGQRATRSALLTRIRNCGADLDVLHLACHGFFDADDALESGIELASEVGGDDVLSALTAADVLAIRIPARLVVLSACETGLNEIQAGDELFGLPRAFLTSGASSVVVSLWPVDDLSTRLLFEHFYEHLAQGANKAEALRAAVQHVRTLTWDDLDRLTGSTDGADRDESIARPFDTPHHWAPFILVGDWH